MIVAVGVDMVEVSRVQRMLDAGRDRVLERILTPAERAYCDTQSRPVEAFAVRFAAKEAVMKCLKTGWTDGVGFRQIEVVRDPRGVPSLALTGRARDVAAALGIAAWHLSLSHTERAAVAFAVATAAD